MKLDSEMKKRYQFYYQHFQHPYPLQQGSWQWSHEPPYSWLFCSFEWSARHSPRRPSHRLHRPHHRSWASRTACSRRCLASRNGPRCGSKLCLLDTRTLRLLRNYTASRCDKSPRRCRSRLFCSRSCTHMCTKLLQIANYQTFIIYRKSPMKKQGIQTEFLIVTQ